MSGKPTGLMDDIKNDGKSRQQKRREQREDEKPKMEITKKTGEPVKERAKRELILTFKDTGTGFESSVNGSGFSMFEQIGIIQSLLTDLINRNFKSESQPKK